MTDQQRKWFASLRAGLQRETGRSLAEWMEIAKTCPESAPRARLKWFKTAHGLLQNRASYVLSAAFPGSPVWDQPDALQLALWTDPASPAILDEVEQPVAMLPGVIASQRKGYSAWSRKYQFAALRPLRGGMARLGMALTPEAEKSLLYAAKHEGWSERLTASAVLKAPRDADKRIAHLLQAAWAAS